MKNILVPTDFSPCSQTAFLGACALADTFGAAVTLLHATGMYEHEPNGEGASNGLDPYVNRRMTEMINTRRGIGKVQVRGISHSTAIIDYAAEHKVDWIVMGTHGRKGFKRWVMGSAAEEIVRFAPCPVWTLKVNSSLDEIKKILVPVDFSSASRSAMRYAIALADKFGADLQLFHVVQEPYFRDLYGVGAEKSQTYLEDTEARARQILNNLLDEEHCAVKAEVVVVTGHPAQAIIRYAADSGSSLVVMGHKGQSHLPERILGSITEYVVRAAPLPVLTQDFPGPGKNSNERRV
jgi:nucleotide-binding universal stress UspA family protein